MIPTPYPYPANGVPTTQGLLLTGPYDDHEHGNLLQVWYFPYLPSYFQQGLPSFEKES